MWSPQQYRLSVFCLPSPHRQLYVSNLIAMQRKTEANKKQGQREGLKQEIVRKGCGQASDAPASAGHKVTAEKKHQLEKNFPEP